MTSKKTSESHGAPLPENSPSLLQLFHDSVKKYPSNIALVCTHQSPDLFAIQSEPLLDDKYKQKPYLRWKYENLKHGVDRFKNALQSRGVHTRTPIVTFVQNSAEYVLTLLAGYELGCIVVPINPRNLSNVEEVVHMLKTVSIAASGRKPVLLAGSLELAGQLDRLLDIEAAIKIAISEGTKDGWIPFNDMMAPSPKHDSYSRLSNGIKTEPHSSLILFTSGTTSLPKGCCWDEGRAAKFLEIRRAISGHIEAGDVWSVVVPNNHALGWLSVIDSICHGAGVVFPGPVFVPASMMESLYREKCTHVTFVPTMVHALLSIKAPKLEHLKHTFLGGSTITPELVRQCIEELGSSRVECGFGMTEGALVFPGGQTKPASLNDVSSVGRVVLGASLKICAPHSTVPVPRGTPGEMHYTGGGLCDGYIGKESNDYYKGSDGQLWFITGDQAIMDDEEQIYIVGRYKEMIIRGGENISPVAIETVLAKDPELAVLSLQIVGAIDSIAGEVPVVVARSRIDAETSQKIQTTILSNMGTIYLPDEVITLQDLGLEDFPRTMAGKIQKAKLTERVRKFCLDREQASTNGTNSQLQDHVKRLWARAVGLEPEQLSLTVPIADFADSITMMRVRDKIKKELGRTLSIEEMANADTLEKQIKLLEERPADDLENKPKRSARPERQGGPAVEDMAHLTEDPDLFSTTKEAVEKVISPYKLAWDDVADVVPVYDFASVLAETRIFESWNFKMALLPKNTDKKQLRAALEMTLRHNPMLASFFVWVKDDMDANVALHVTIKHEQKYLQQVIQDGGTVSTVEDLRTLPFKYPQPWHATFPGPMFRILLYYVEELKSSALLFNANHAVIDASFTHQGVFEDFDKALLASTTQLDDHVDYKIWADSYFSVRQSPEARAATKWHIKRLKGLATHRKAIYPPIPDRALWDPTLEADAEDGVQLSFEAPGIPALRKKYRTIAPYIPLKAAFTLLNIQRTGHTHALFSNLEAARTTFPFIPRSMASLSQFEATDVAGPTIESVINLIELKFDETVAEFLQRMQEDQRNLTKYASAPWREIMSGLGKEAGDMIPTVTQACVFNWVPGMGTTGTEPYSNFKVLNAVVRPRVGLAVNAGLGGAASSTMFLHLRGDALSEKEMQGLAVDLEKITTWLTDSQNWDVSVSQYVDALSA